MCDVDLCWLPVLYLRYDSEYDNYRGGMTSDCESEMNGEEGEKEGQEENIRQISQNITNKFGNHRYWLTTVLQYLIKFVIQLN